MAERSGIILICRADRLPIISRVLVQGEGSTATVIPIDTVAGDTVKFEFMNANTAEVFLDFVTATVVDGPGGEVAYTWAIGDTDHPGGIHLGRFRIVRGTGAKWTMPDPIQIMIWEPIVAPGYWFAPIETVKAHLDIRDHTRDDVVKIIVSSVTADLEREIGYGLVSRTYVHDGVTLQKLNGSGSFGLRLPQKNVTAIASIDVEDEGALTASDRDVIRFDADSGVVYRVDGGIFPAGIQNVAVTFTAGWTQVPTASPTFPGDLMRLGLERCGAKWLEWPRKTTGQEASILVGGQIIQTADPDFTNEQLRTLSRYIRYGSW